MNCRQIGRRDPERGGQLFATFTGSTMRIEEATGPHRGARAGRFWFRGNRRREIREIKRQFKTGKHYVGDWHSHPEPSPTPSSLDMKTQRSLASHSEYELNGLLLVIVGQLDLPAGLCVYFVDREGVDTQLIPTTSGDGSTT